MSLSFLAKLEMKKLKQLLALVTPNSQPNLNALNDIVKDVRIIELNIKAFGYELARKMAAALPVPEDTSERYVGLQSKAATQADIESDWAAHWARQVGSAVIYHRKVWELVYVLQALYDHGHMAPGRRGLGFGCGVEPIPSYLTSKGVAVTITDMPHEQAQAQGWVATDQHVQSLDQAHHANLVPRDVFDSLTTLRNVDMNHIPADLTGYDFCWSVCALEHLGSIANGLAFLESSLRTLRPGGLSIHTMEFNIEADGPTVDDWPTVLFQRKHIEGVAARLRAQGHEVAELNFDTGTMPMDNFIDLPPWCHDMPKHQAERLGNPVHLKLAVDGFVSTCFGIIIRKKAEG